MTTKSINKYLFITGGPTSVGKTTIAAVCADWARCRGKTIQFLDYDISKRGAPTAFANFAQGEKGAMLNVQDEDDLDALLRGTSGSDIDCTFADLPGNASHQGSVVLKWFQEIGQSTEFEFYGIRLITIVPIVPMPGSTQAALQWMNSVGPQGVFLVALNRMQFSLYEKPIKDLFDDWMSVDAGGFNIKTVEVPHLQGKARNWWVSSRRLPSKEEPGDPREHRLRIKKWKNTIHDQLDLAGILEEKSK